MQVKRRVKKSLQAKKRLTSFYCEQEENKGHSRQEMYTSI